MITRNSAFALVLGCLPFAGVARADEPVASGKHLSNDISVKENTPFGDYTVTSRTHFMVADADGDGSLDLSDKKDCSRFLNFKDVFLSAGAQEDGLEDGRYIFIVIAPGYQNGGFRDGLDGNLSDRVAGSTTGDGGSGDFTRNRTFEVSNHEITNYNGSHTVGKAADGQMMVAVAPFDETPNPGDVYVLAICPVGATLAVQCRFDAFRVGLTLPMARAIVSGRGYYDANVNGKLDQGEPTLDDGTISYWDSMQGSEQLALDGGFSVVVAPDAFVFAQQAAGRNWMQTGNQISQAVVVGDASVQLTDDLSYAVSIGAGAAVDGLQFGSVCLGAGGSRRLGYWASMASMSVLGQDDLKLLVSLHLTTQNGQPYDPPTLEAFQHWLRVQNEGDLSAQLSVHLAVAALNVHNGFVDDQALVYMPNTDAADSIGFGMIDDLIAEADAALATNRVASGEGTALFAHWSALNIALKEVNTNSAFVQKAPRFCTLRLDGPVAPR